MKVRAAFFFLAAASTALILTVPGYPQGGGSSYSPGVAAPILSVTELMKNVARHRGPVRVEGVVSAVDPGQQAIILIETREFKACGVTNCASLYLPVRWSGPMPQVRDLVRLEGEVKEWAGKLVFEARTLKKLLPR